MHTVSLKFTDHGLENNNEFPEVMAHSTRLNIQPLIQSRHPRDISGLLVVGRGDWLPMTGEPVHLGFAVPVLPTVIVTAIKLTDGLGDQRTRCVDCAPGNIFDAQAVGAPIGTGRKGVWRGGHF